MTDDQYFAVVDNEVQDWRYRTACVDDLCFHVSDQGRLPDTVLSEFVRRDNLGRGAGAFTPVGERHDVRLATFSGEGSAVPNGHFDAESYGGWLEHSTFALVGIDYIGGDFDGYGEFYSYSIGSASGSLPSGSATWTGVVVGTDLCTYCETFGNIVQGDARIGFEFSEGVPLFNIEPGTPLFDVAFTSLRDINAGTRLSDIRWDDLRVVGDSFSQPKNSFGDYLHGQLYGPNHEEVGGVFEHGDISGAFGGKRQ